jgi:hypothetical protein
MMVFAGMMMMVIVAFAAFAINLTYIELARTELRIATDAAARAAGRELIRTGGDLEMAKLKGKEAANRNFVVGQRLLLDDADFVFGTSSRNSSTQRYNFVPDTEDANAVLVNGRFSEDSPNGPVQLCMPIVMGMGTFETSQNAIAAQSELDIALVLDRSGSMAFSIDENGASSSVPASAPAGWSFGQAVPPNSRWHDAVNATNQFMQTLSNTPANERIALCTYNELAWNETDFSQESEDISISLDNHTQAFEGGATNIGGGIQAGLDALSAFDGRPWATKLMIIMTDGIHNSGTAPSTATVEAQAAGVIIYTISFSNDADTTSMAQVASATGGKHFHAPTTEALNDAFQEIGRSLPSLLAK